jgi:GntR family transcriptional regulator, transcriptional repressor for pyruvate dehydrogenase complex
MAKNVEYPVLQRNANLADRLADSVMQLIISNALAPGDRLPSERELGEQFGVSRTVVREAFRSLSAKGVLDVRSGSGVTVARVDASHASETLRMYVQFARSAEEGDEGGIRYEHIDDVRELLETRVARIAASAATAQELATLRDLHAEMAEALHDTERASALDVAFHRAIAACTHNPLYLIMLDSIEPVLLEIRLNTLGVPGRPERAIAAHQEILDRIVAGDATGAEAAMHAHLTDSRAVWRSGH